MYVRIVPALLTLKLMQLKPVKDLENHYLVSTCGKLFSAKTLKEIKPKPNGRGYLVHTTRLSTGTVRVRLHRAVAEAFVENKDSKPIVNHKDGCKQNNASTNLEWNSHSENTSHAWKTGLRR